MHTLYARCMRIVYKRRVIKAMAMHFKEEDRGKIRAVFQIVKNQLKGLKADTPEDEVKLEEIKTALGQAMLDMLLLISE